MYDDASVLRGISPHLNTNPVISSIVTNRCPSHLKPARFRDMTTGRLFALRLTHPTFGLSSLGHVEAGARADKTAVMLHTMTFA